MEAPVRGPGAKAHQHHPVPARLKPCPDTSCFFSPSACGNAISPKLTSKSRLIAPRCSGARGHWRPRERPAGCRSALPEDSGEASCRPSLPPCGTPFRRPEHKPNRGRAGAVRPRRAPPARDVCVLAVEGGRNEHPQPHHAGIGNLQTYLAVRMLGSMMEADVVDAGAQHFADRR